MPFSSLLFLSGFLPAFLLLYWLAPRALRNGVALAFSIVFYAWGAPRLLPVVLALGVIDFYLGRLIARTREAARASAQPAEVERLQRRARRMLVCGITVHLSVLAYFKYSNFLVAETNALLVHLPSAMQVSWKEVTLPIGISFLTFEEISYLVDVYRGDARPARSVGRYLLFLMLFPHSIAGPIFRWKDLEAQLDAREHSLANVTDGLARFVLGLAKKLLIADAAALAADRVFAAPPGVVGPGLAWIGVVAYTLQIYFDFSGYSDMAIGLGRMIGFRFKENFDSPYVSASITEFWQRWHISLSTWMRDYLYVPLGGNRRGELRTRMNVVVVFALSGFWHGAAWTFLAWGLYHGGLLTGTQHARRRGLGLPRPLAIAATFLLVMIGWVLFRMRTAADIGAVYAGMLGLHGLGGAPGHLLAYLLVAGAIVALLPESWRLPLSDWRAAPVAAVAVLLVVAAASVYTSHPFIYFRF